MADLNNLIQLFAEAKGAKAEKVTALEYTGTTKVSPALYALLPSVHPPNVYPSLDTPDPDFNVMTVPSICAA